MQPHLQDVGLPEYFLLQMGGCFYAMMGLSVEGGTVSGKDSDNGNGDGKEFNKIISVVWLCKRPTGLFRN